MSLRIGQMQRPEAAFAAAVTFMAARHPFSALPFGKMAEAISGAVRRGHYAIASEDRRVVGVVFWAMTSADIARRWTEEGYEPTYDEAVSGDTIVLTMGAGDHPSVALQGVKHIARRYRGHAYRMVRHGRKSSAGRGSKTGRFPG